MSVMELAVQGFGAKLGITLVSERKWQVILDQVNSAIRALDQKDGATIMYAGISSHLSKRQGGMKRSHASKANIIVRGSRENLWRDKDVCSESCRG
jgi:hypothetical protein